MSNTTNEIVDERVDVYGEPLEFFSRLAMMWSALLDHEIQPHEVPLMMASLKMLRTQITPDYSDNSDDVFGYMEIFRVLMGGDMIEARTVPEYLILKEGRG